MEIREKGLERPLKILVLCVDRDDDIGEKAEVRTPVVGEESVKDAGVKLAIADPEEADANAIFEALKTYKHLKNSESGDEYEVALIAGSKVGGIQADRKILKELDQVLSRFKADYAILISDGYSDEVVIPVIQSRIPIMSIKRVVIKHSKSIEEFWAVLTGYVRSVVKDPYYSKIALGVPGLFLLSLSILWYLNLLFYGALLFLALIGILLIVKGFRLDELIGRKFEVPPPYAQIKIYSKILCLVLMLIGSYKGLAYVGFKYTKFDLSSFPVYLGHFIQNSVDLIIIGVCVYLLGSGITYYLTHDSRLWRNIVGAVAAVFLYPVFLEVANILLNPFYGYGRLLYWVVITICVSTVSAIAVYYVSRRYKI